MKTALLLLIALAGLCRLNAEDVKFEVPFGIFAPRSDGQLARLAEETLTIPLRLRETGFRWGFAIVPEKTGEYTWRAVFYLPQPPESVGAREHVVKRSGASPNIAEIPVRSETEATAFVGNFDKGDPLGVWRVEIFINDKIARTILFDVVEDK